MNCLTENGLAADMTQLGPEEVEILAKKGGNVRERLMELLSYCGRGYGIFQVTVHVEGETLTFIYHIHGSLLPMRGLEHNLSTSLVPALKCAHIIFYEDRGYPLDEYLQHLSHEKRGTSAFERLVRSVQLKTSPRIVTDEFLALINPPVTAHSETAQEKKSIEKVKTQ